MIQTHPQYATYYTPYGYLEFDQNEVNSQENLYAHIKPNPKQFTGGSVNKQSISDTILIKLKTLYGTRKFYTFTMNISEKISEILIRLAIEEDKLNAAENKFKLGTQYTLTCTRSMIRELDPNKTFREENIKDGEVFMLLPVSRLLFSELMHGPSVFIENRGTVAFKQDNDEPQFAITNQGYSFGKHYCEFILETEPLERNIVVGVTTERKNDYNAVDLKGFYGFLLSDCKKISNTTGKVEQTEYGDVTKIGDRVGLLMEFTPTGLDISFYINKIDMGVAFQNLKTGIYYPCAVLGLAGTKVRITNKVEFPDV